MQAITARQTEVVAAIDACSKSIDGYAINAPGEYVAYTARLSDSSFITKLQKALKPLGTFKLSLSDADYGVTACEIIEELK